jgi:hypothetical protein
MNCHKHNSQNAVAQCVDCGRGLCPSCTERFSFPVCDGCNLKRLGNDKKVLIRNVLLMAVIFFAGFQFAHSQREDFWDTLMTAYALAGLPWGWSFLTRITPQMFLFMPLFGWVVYFVLKFFLAFLIGPLVTPFKIYQMIRQYRSTKIVKEMIRTQD